MNASVNHAPTFARLPPDVVSASWSWQLDLIEHRRVGYHAAAYVLRSRQPLLTCDVRLTDTDDYADLIVMAEHSDGHQTASLSYTTRRPRVYPRTVTHDVVQILQTSQGLIHHRVQSWCSAPTAVVDDDLVSTSGITVDAWAEPSDVVAFVKSLEMYARDEVWF